MKVFAAVLLTACIAFGTEPGNCSRAFVTEFRHGGNLELDLRSGDIDISGSNEAALSVECSAGGGGDTRDIQIDFERKGHDGRLRVHGGPHQDVKIRIRVPKELHLVLRCTAGDVDISGIRGSKDISLRAGDLTVDVGDPRDYATAEASVKAGDIKAPAFGTQKGGLFRSFSHNNPGGKYHLRASLWAGDLKLQ